MKLWDLTMLRHSHLCCLQAIALIVTHRTDDMAKLPPVLITEAPKESKLAAGMASVAFLSTIRSKDVHVTGMQPVSSCALPRVPEPWL